MRAIVEDEPRADYKRVHTELKRLYQVVVPHRRLRTYLASLGRSTIASTADTAIEASRRRTPKKDAEEVADWLMLNEDRVIALLKTLDAVGRKVMQRSVEAVCKVTVALQPLQTSLDKHYDGGGRLYRHRAHKEAEVALTDQTYEDEISSV